MPIMRHPLSAKLDFLITHAFAALFFFVPLLFLPFTNELFEFNKMQLTYTLTIIITSLWLFQAFLNRRLSINKSFLLIPLGLFLLSQTLSTIFSINPHTSIWGYYSRFHGGLASTITYLSLYLVFTSHFADKKDKLTITVIPSILISGGLTATYAVLEHFGIDSKLWVQDVQSRVFSTLGQPNWLSAYLCALLPLPIYLGLNTKSLKVAARYYLLALLFLVTILFTKSRSGIGATFIILSLVALHQLLSQRKSPKFPSFIRLALGFFLLIVLAGTPWSPNPAQIVQRLDLGGPLWPEIQPYLTKINLSTQIKPLEVTRLSQIDQQAIAVRSRGERFGGSDSFEIRRFVWEGAVELFHRYPILGTGTETFGYTYYWVKPKGHNLLSEWDFLYNKAHNEYLNFLANTGALGLGTYALLTICILYLFYSRLKTDPKQPLTKALALGFISILITNYFGFSVVPIALFFFLFPALGTTLRSSKSEVGSFFSVGPGWQLTKKEIKRGHSFSLGASEYFFLPLTVLIGGYLALIIFHHWQADVLYTKGKSYSDIGYVGNALPYLQKAVAAYPSEPTVRAELSESYADATLAITQQLDSPEATDSATKQQLQTARDDFEQKALTGIETTLTQNPWHLNFYKSKIKILLSLASYKPQFQQQAIDTILKASQLAPTDAKLLFTLGTVYQRMSDIDRARAAFSAALDLKSDYQEVINALNSLPKK